MTDHDIDLTKAIEAGAKAMADDWNPDRSPIFAAMFLDYAQSTIEAALPHILAQVEARVKPSREQMIRVLKYEFGSFLAHTPHDPGRFWGLSADTVLALFDGKTEQEVREEVAAEIEAEAGTWTPQEAVAPKTREIAEIMVKIYQDAAKLARGGEGR